MADQLELTATEEEGLPTVTVGIPAPLLKRLGRLEPDAREEFERRLALAMEQAYEALAEVRSLSFEQLIVRRAIARRDVEIFTEEMDRRASARRPTAPVPPLHA